MARTLSSETPAGPGGSPPGGRARVVLLVEDDDAVRNVARRMLEFRGLTVLPVAGPAAALETSAAYLGRVDVLVTDVNMPGMTGPELAERVWAERPALRVVFMSGSLPEDVFGPDWHDDRALFLPKPFTPGQLADALARVLAAVPPGGGTLGPPSVDETAGFYLP